MRSFGACGPGVRALLHDKKGLPLIRKSLRCGRPSLGALDFLVVCGRVGKILPRLRKYRTLHSGGGVRSPLIRPWPFVRRFFCIFTAEDGA
jgi:hypothetical protein